MFLSAHTNRKLGLFPTKFVLLGPFALIQTICSKIQKAHFRLTCVALKRLCLSSLLVFQNNKTAALLVFQTSPVGVESRE